MNREDTVYKYRDDEMGLVRLFVSGEFDEDLIAHNMLYQPIFGQSNNMEGSPMFYISPDSPSGDKVNVDMEIYDNNFSGTWSFLRDVGNVKSARLKINIPETAASNARTSGNILGGALQGIEYGEIIFNDKRNSSSRSIGLMTRNDHIIQAAELRTLVLRYRNPNNIAGSIFTDNWLSGSKPQLSTIVLDNCKDGDTYICIVPMNSNALNTSEYFKSGGTGGTIYIPRVLYNHLGDGSEYDYKSATNWSRFDSYGTITWAQIEGSEYEAE